ncbi:MAG: hypothetical protein IPO21_17875 [Bacteroidales bacterium]|nr:hypothetical protein [Bacteroidales bacterium]
MLETNIVAIFLMLIATSMMNIGMVFQKKGIMSLALKVDSIQSKQLKFVFREKIWVVGWALALVAMILNCIALSLGNLSLLQPLVGFGLVVMVLFSRIYLHESITKKTIVGMFCIIAGVVLLGVTAPQSHIYASTSEITAVYLSKRAVFTFSCIIIFCTALYLFWYKRESSRKGIFFAFIAGILSVLGMTFGKSIFVVLHLAGMGISPQHAFHFSLFLFGQIVSLVAFVILQFAFSKSKAVVVLPIFHVTTVATPFLIGPLVFMEKLSWQIMPAMALMILGIIFISLRKSE